MADIYCPTVIHPVIALADMTPLEALLLSQVFDAEPEADGLYFFAEQGPNDAIRLPVKQLRALLSASAGVPSTAADQVVRCLAAVPDGETEIVLDLSGSQGDQDTDINRSTWRDILQDIVRRSPRLRSVTAVSSFTGSKLRHDYVGGKVVFVTADQIQTRSTADIEEEFHAQVPEIKDHAAPSGDTATGDPSCTTGMLFATTLVDWRVAEGDDDRLPSALRAPYCVTISRGGQGGLILDVTAPNGALTEFDLEADAGTVTLSAFSPDPTQPGWTKETLAIVMQVGQLGAVVYGAENDQPGMAFDDGQAVILPPGLIGPTLVAQRLIPAD